MGIATEELQAGRTGYAAGAWKEAHARLTAADAADSLGAEDLELLATAAYMLGLEDRYFEALERAHGAHLEAGESLRAARCAFWIGVNLARGGEMGRAGGWLSRAQRLVERHGSECVEQGYLLIPVAFEQEGGGELDAAVATLGEAVEVAHRFGEADLHALALHQQGHVLVLNGRAREGLPLLDEAMVSVTTGELSPIVSGIVYCGVILGCQAAYEPRRAREWTSALTQWCAAQPDMVAFTGRCLIHRAEILQLQGAWTEAIEEARRAAERSTAAQNDAAAGEALYREGDVLRQRGELAAAEDAYRDASRRGREPQPGLALLRLDQGDREAAVAAIRRAVSESRDSSQRASLLPAKVEILLAAGETDEAREPCAELEEIAASFDSELLGARAAQARGALALAAGDPAAALAPLRRSLEGWLAIGAPYDAARARVLAGQACRELGDADAAAMEFDAARAAFAELGAAPELARLDSLTGVAPADTQGLTPRELEVLRLVAAGSTNKAIAAELVVSERTVDRHVSNILAKLRLPSRAAATAFAYEHDLV